MFQTCSSRWTSSYFILAQKAWHAFTGLAKAAMSKCCCRPERGQGIHRRTYQRRDVMCLGQRTPERHVWAPWNLLIPALAQRPYLTQGFLCTFLIKTSSLLSPPFPKPVLCKNLKLIYLKLSITNKWEFPFLTLKMSSSLSCSRPKLAFRREFEIYLL